MTISDHQAGKVVATVPIGKGVDGAGYDAVAGNAFVSNADRTLTVIHQDSPNQYHVIQTLSTPVGARNLGLDPTNHACSSLPQNSGLLQRVIEGWDLCCLDHSP